MIYLRFDSKGPQDTDDYTLDFASLGWLGANDAITGANVTTSPAGLTVIGSPAISSGKVSVRLTGGTVGTDYGVAFSVTTQSGRQDTRTVMLYCDNM